MTIYTLERTVENDKKIKKSKKKDLLKQYAVNASMTRQSKKQMKRIKKKYIHN